MKGRFAHRYSGAWRLKLGAEASLFQIPKRMSQTNLPHLKCWPSCSDSCLADNEACSTAIRQAIVTGAPRSTPALRGPARLARPTSPLLSSSRDQQTEISKRIRWPVRNLQCGCGINRGAFLLRTTSPRHAPPRPAPPCPAETGAQGHRRMCVFGLSEHTALYPVAVWTRRLHPEAQWHA